ncbi:SIMPL domain-containing protein [Calidifontibacillus oryziterrae]|uniref:SIMPL domain-containing protein n=1 Tax=Calidifontibacillus oryziterrae TaxID=1191699 RepID=UPI00031FBAFB|nr:SIMPL domain-containing protein [Calidifontibacillus oryziterrae]
MTIGTMKKIIGIVVMAILFITLNSLTSSTNAYANESELSKKTISVNGEYSVKVAPDIAYIDIAVNTFNEDAKKAQELNKHQMNKVMEQLKNLGLEEKDIRTTDYRIQPRYEWKNVEKKNNQGGIETIREQILIGYEVINNIRVTVNDFQKVGTIIDTTVKEGANKINNIAFGLSDAVKTKKYLEALKGAVQNGKSKAEYIASIYGISLTVPAVISESGAYLPSPINYGMEKVSASGVSYDSVSSTPISGGEMEIRANVNIIYQY